MGEQKQRMLAGELYCADDPELAADSRRAQHWLDRYNATAVAEPALRLAMLRELFASVGDGALVRPPFFCDYGRLITLGERAFLNFGCVILDVAPVSIGARTKIGPGVQILAADHPRDPEARRSLLECARPVTIGENVWIGAGALILPGVTVGDDAIVGAGAVVTRSVAPGDTVAGNPARPLRRAC